MAVGAQVLPEVLPVPPEDIRKRISRKEWQDCVEIWTLLSHAYLSLPLQQFRETLEQPSGKSLNVFVLSYLETMGQAHSDDNYLALSQATKLRRNVYLLIHRQIFEVQDSAGISIADWKILGNLSRVYKHNVNLRMLAEKIWRNHESTLDKALNDGYKQDLLNRLKTEKLSNLPQDYIFVQQLLPLLRASPSAGMVFVTGSDLVDTLALAYPQLPAEVRSVLLLFLYLCLLAPLETEKQNFSLLYDHLYSLKLSAESHQNPILADLVSDTPFLAKVRKTLIPQPNARTEALLQSLAPFQRPTTKRHQKSSRHKAEKGKGKAIHGESQEMHIHHLDKITQLQDLFPNLGSAFTAKLLDEYGDNVETVTAHLLEDDLPEHLRNADRSENLLPQTHGESSDQLDREELAKDLSPAPTPPPPEEQPQRHLPTRQNVHDNDAFDRLSISANQIHIGRRETQLSQTASDRLASKAAILSALSAFDADDDERDDTYDVEDVGGTVDTAASQDEHERQQRPRHQEDVSLAEPIEAKLLSTYKAHPELFARDANTRRSKERKALREETALDNERLEGWAVMMSREPARLRKLESKYAAGGGGSGGLGGTQTELGRTAWRGRTQGSEEEGDTDEASSGAEAMRGSGARARGTRQPARGRGAAGVNVAGPSEEKATQVSRQRKVANKSSRANHNRRDQRAKKMARGGFPA